MGKINFGQRHGLSASLNTKTEFARDVSDEILDAVLNKVTCALSEGSARCCYVLGLGAHPRSTYTNLLKLVGLEVIFFRSVLPKYLRFLSPIVASHQGLLKINDPSVLRDVFLKLIDHSMAGIYCFEAALERDFLQATQNAFDQTKYDFGVKNDRAYLIYMVDADSNESSTGMIEIISCGVETPLNLVPVF